LKAPSQEKSTMNIRIYFHFIQLAYRTHTKAICNQLERLQNLFVGDDGEAKMTFFMAK
jgi:hypothetical protein